MPDPQRDAFERRLDPKASRGRADATVWVSPFQREGVTLKGDMISTTATLLSQREEHVAVVVEDFPETPHWTRNDTDFPRPLR